MIERVGRLLEERAHDRRADRLLPPLRQRVARDDVEPDRSPVDRRIPADVDRRLLATRRGEVRVELIDERQGHGRRLIGRLERDRPVGRAADASREQLRAFAYRDRRRLERDLSAPGIENDTVGDRDTLGIGVDDVRVAADDVLGDGERQQVPDFKPLQAEARAAARARTTGPASQELTEHGASLFGPAATMGGQKGNPFCSGPLQRHRSAQTPRGCRYNFRPSEITRWLQIRPTEGNF